MTGVELMNDGVVRITKTSTSRTELHENILVESAGELLFRT